MRKGFVVHADETRVGVKDPNGNGYVLPFASPDTANKLFAFLDHDGVPWNNNAENAVKLFAARRKVMGTLFTERGIKDYLLLLSLYQTLRYRGIGFWKLLLSGETDLAAFTAKSR